MGDSIGSDPRHRGRGTEKLAAFLDCVTCPPPPPPQSHDMFACTTCVSCGLHGFAFFFSFFFKVCFLAALNTVVPVVKNNTRGAYRLACQGGVACRPTVTCNRRSRVREKNGSPLVGGERVGACLAFFITAVYIWRRHVFLSFHFFRAGLRGGGGAQ